MNDWYGSEATLSSENIWLVLTYLFPANMNHPSAFGRLALWLCCNVFHQCG